MRRKGYRGVGCVKRSFSKCKDVCKTYDKIQTVYAEQLQNDERLIVICFDLWNLFTYLVKGIFEDSVCLFQYICLMYASY